MEKQSKLVKNLLKLLSQADVLDHVLLIGSWCASFYKPYFKGIDYSPRIMTRDIDFLLPRHPQFKKTIDLEMMLQPLGFEIGFYGKGYMKLENPELIIELLVPEVGRPSDHPKKVPELKFNAQPLRHLEMLWRDPIRTTVEGVEVMLPHPADYCIQKFIIASERKKRDKAQKDREVAAEVLRALQILGDTKSLRSTMGSLSDRERKTVQKELTALGIKIDIS